MELKQHRGLVLVRKVFTEGVQQSFHLVSSSNSSRLAPLGVSV